MRFIDKSELTSKISDDWLARAKQALEELCGKTEAERKAYIKDNPTWSEIKGCLCQVSNDKCWYSERKLSRSELEIDHFRPKSKVAKIKHPGYWWLAYEWENFRLSTSLVNKRREDFRNSGKQIMGKGTYFPLEDERKRVSSYPPGTTRNESPLLVDPTVSYDINLLDYNTGCGKVVPKHEETRNKIKYLRAKISIELYHLNDGHLIKERFNIYSTIDKKAKRLDELFEKQDNSTLTNDEEQELDSLYEEVSMKVNSSSPYSAFARKCLMENGDRGWNTELLMAC